MTRYILMQGEDVIGECWTDNPEHIPLSSEIHAIEQLSGEVIFAAIPANNNAGTVTANNSAKSATDNSEEPAHGASSAEGAS